MALPDRWLKLYEKVGREKQSRVEADDKTRDEVREKEFADKAYSELANKALKSIKELAVVRGKELASQGGGAVTVTYPAQAPTEHVAQVSQDMKFLKLSLDRAAVYLYSARSPSKLPALHLLAAVDQLRPAKARAARESSSPSRERVVSKLIGRIVPAEGPGYELRAPASNGTGALLDEDAIVFEAFDVLIKLWRRARKPA